MRWRKNPEDNSFPCSLQKQRQKWPDKIVVYHALEVSTISSCDYQTLIYALFNICFHLPLHLHFQLFLNIHVSTDDGLFFIPPSVSLLTRALLFPSQAGFGLFFHYLQDGEEALAKSEKEERNTIQESLIIASVVDPEELMVLYH